MIDQNPPAGILLRKGQAVSLTVSNGVRIVVVPNGLIGQTLDGAKAALVAAGLQGRPHRAEELQRARQPGPRQQARRRHASSPPGRRSS